MKLTSTCSSTGFSDLDTVVRAQGVADGLFIVFFGSCTQPNITNVTTERLAHPHNHLLIALADADFKGTTA